MDISSLLKIGAEAFINSNKSGETGSGLDIGSLLPALSGLLGGGQGSLDLSSLISKFSSAGLGNVVNSWSQPRRGCRWSIGCNSADG
jgi:uncharacterized protein YidB (DUF937 family)